MFMALSSVMGGAFPASCIAPPADGVRQLAVVGVRLISGGE
jgi:hypothetical protein